MSNGPLGPPEVAVVIPCLDEAAALGDLLGDLRAQRGVALEVVVVDGGSSDGTVGVAEAFASAAPFLLTVRRAPRGRARQLNDGARHARAPDLLFLHADCRVDDPDLVARARTRLARERQRLDTDRLAGHFGLRFRRSDERPSLAYHYYEAKAALCRSECVNGDQGFWLSRRYFDELGGFEESAPLLEDARLAERVFATGRWVALPGTVSTSARRFEAEGLLERQTVNALVRACHALALESFFQRAAALYRVHSEADRLDLLPFFRTAHRAVWDAGGREGLRRWLRAGRYVRRQAWQLAFWLDCRRNFGRRLRPGRGPAGCLEAWDLLAGVPGPRLPADVAAAALTAGWLYGGLAWFLASRVFSVGRRRNSR